MSSAKNLVDPNIHVVPYDTKYKVAFRKLNEEWILNYFKMEEPDYEVLDHPQEYILDRGGSIFVALFQKRPVGVCALIRRDDLQGFELAKMAVAPEMRGKNIGWLLSEAVIDQAISLSAQRIYLESNTILRPAIRLYEKLGFKKVLGPATHYERCDIQMELILK